MRLPIEPSRSARSAASALGPTESVSFLNDSIAPGLQIEPQILLARSIAAAPIPGSEYVAGRCGQNQSESCIELISNTTHAVVNAFVVPVCPGLGAISLMGLVAAPVGNILYLECGDGAVVALNATSGGLLGSVQAPSISGGGVCASEVAGVGAALDVADHLLFSLAESLCVSAPQNTTFNVSLEAINTSSYAIAWTLPYVSFTPWYDLATSAPLAFDAATGQLYIDLPPTNLTPPTSEVGIVAPRTGALAERVPVVDAAFAGTWLTYLPATGSVYTVGLRSATPGNLTASVELIDAVLGKEIPLTNETGSPTAAPFDVYYGLIAGSGTPATLAVLGQWEYTPLPPTTPNPRPDNAFWLSLPSLSMSADVRFPGGIVGGATTGANSLALLDASDDLVILASGSPPVARHTAVLGSAYQEAAVDPTNGTLWVVLDSDCPILSGGPCGNATLEVFPPGAAGPSETAQLPQGTPSGITYNPVDHEFFILTTCGPGSRPFCAANDTITAYSSDGALLSSSTVPSTTFSPPETPLVVDGATGALVASLVAPRGGVLFYIPPATPSAAVAITLPLPAGVVSCPERMWVAYDSVDALLLVRTICISTRYVPVQWALNATTLAPLYSIVATNGSGPLAFDPTTDALYMANGSAVVTISPTTGAFVSAYAPTGGVGDVAFDPTIGALYLLGTNLTVVNASTFSVLESVSFSGLPPSTFISQLVVDPRTGTAMLPLYSDALMLVVSGPGIVVYPVVFTETGLPPYASWSVFLTVPGVTLSGTGALSYLLPNGSYPFVVGAKAGYSITSGGTGTTVISGSGVTAPNVSFAPTVYPITFHGGVSGGGWSVFLLPTGDTARNASCGCTATSASVTFTRPDGTYAYLIEGNTSRAAVASLPPAGEVIVNGSAVSLAFSVTGNVSPSVSFQAIGLMPGASWCVTIASAREQCSTGGRATFAGLTPGNYSYTVAPSAGFLPRHPTGQLRLGHGSPTVGVPFRAATYLVSFAESGLVAGHGWKVAIDGRHVSSRHPQLSLTLPNGTYAFATAPIPGYTGGQSGLLTVDGGALLIAAPFVRVVYAVTISEVGLPANSAWTIKVGPTTFTVHGSSLVIDEPNGSYGLRVGAVSGYGHTISPTALHVHGGPASVSVTFHLLRGGSPTGVRSPAIPLRDGTRPATDALARPP